MKAHILLLTLLCGVSLAARAQDHPQYSSAGSVYVPLESWVYPALERLAALGYVRTQFAGMRPWTRLECARLVDEAGERMEEMRPATTEAVRLYHVLEKEFGAELDILGGGGARSIRLESVYARFTGILGSPLTDGYHFGQTIVNDYGRPYQEGANLVTGFSARAVLGRFAAYVRGEYQHAPSAPALAEGIRNLIATVDDNPVQPATPIAERNQFRLLDAYVAMNLNNWQISFGKQSLWWGSGDCGPLLFSNNAEPIYMLRANRVMPFKLPGFLAWLGPVRTEFFFGQLSGHHFPPRPLLLGQKISFKPSPNWELGLSRTVVFAGVGHPLTPRSLFRSLFAVGGGETSDTGDKRVALDLSYRVGEWLTVYSNFMWDDAIQRTTMSPGIYVPRLPGLSKLDFRAEAVSTDVPAPPLAPGIPFGTAAGQRIYWNDTYHDAYTNKGYLLGSWVGRQGLGFHLESTYWLSHQSRVQVGHRHAKVNADFIPGGGTLNDFGARTDLQVRDDVTVSGLVQYERWTFPVLAPASKTNVTASVQITFWPKWGSK